MGAETRYAKAKGISLKQAWEDLVEEDVYDRGHEYYGGNFGTCDFPRLVKKFSDDLRKGEVEAICIKEPIPNTNKIKTEVENFPCKTTREWITEYYGVTWIDRKEVCLDESQVKCIEKARAYVEKNPFEGVEIHIRKKLKNLPTKVAKIKYKKSTTEQLGEWKFFAVVPS